MYILAVDIGGTKIATGILNQADEWVFHDKFESVPTSEESMYEALVNSIEKTVKNAGLSLTDIQAIGVTVPGQIDTENGIAIFQNNLPWRHFPLKERLAVDFPNQVTAFEHDVVSAAIGEWTVRKLDQELMLYMTISTGIASTIIHQGKPIRGMGLAGESGLILMADDRSLEEHASGPAMASFLSELDPSTHLIEAFEKLESGNERYLAFFKERARDIANGIYTQLSILDPHKIVLGGGVINNQPTFYQLIVDELNALTRHPFQEDWADRLERSLLKGHSGLFGVADKARKLKV